MGGDVNGAAAVPKHGDGDGTRGGGAVRGDPSLTVNTDKRAGLRLVMSPSPTGPDPDSPGWRISNPLEPPPKHWAEKWHVNSLTPLALACRGGFLDVVSTLVALGEDVNEPSSATGGIHPVMVAARAHQWQVVQILICSGADPHVVDEARTYAGTLWSKDRAEAVARIESAVDWKETWERWPPSQRRNFARRRKRKGSVWEEGCLTH